MKGHRRSSTVVLGWRPPAVRCTCLPSGHPVTVDVCAAVRGCPTSSACASEPLPKRTLMESVDVLAPFIVELFKPLAFSRVVPAVFKEAFIIPLLKKPDLDSADPRS